MTVLTNIIIMKRLLLLLSIIIFCSSNSISQELEQEIFVLDFSKSNSKKFIVLEINDQYIFKAFNKENKEVQRCKWKITLNNKQIKELQKSLELLLENHKKEDESHLYELIRKKDAIKLLFKNSKCSAEHKTYYFQKDCNRNFVIKMKAIEFEKLLYNLNKKKEDL